MFDILKFGAGISKHRKLADMTQSELADKVNLTRQTISKYERGESFPDMSTLMAIANVFNMPVESLINAGEPTKTEAEILLFESATNAAAMDEIMNIAPLIKPSILDALVVPLEKHGIDLSHLVALSEYMNEQSVALLAESLDLDMADPELLKRLIPVLSDDSKLNLFETKNTQQEVRTHEVCFNECDDMEMKFSSLVITCINDNGHAKTSVLVDGKEIAKKSSSISFDHNPNGDVKVSLRRTLHLTPSN